MRITVLYFAVVKERLGRSGETIDVAQGATVATALDSLKALHADLGALLPQLRTAVNREMAPATQPLADGDELALIPPVAGGANGRRIAVRDSALSLDEVMAAVTAPEQGGIVTFTGCVRRQGQLSQVDHLEYEAFVPMAEQVLAAIADEIENEWPGVRVAIQHRTGTLVVGQPAVIIAASAPHRAEAFEACRAAIERLKQRAPIWKKETGADGAVWVGLGP